jgi:hypothetical protein
LCREDFAAGINPAHRRGDYRVGEGFLPGFKSQRPNTRRWEPGIQEFLPKGGCSLRLEVLEILEVERVVVSNY